MKKIKSYATILTGVIMLCASISFFSVPNKIVNGGVSGIATILYYLFKIPVGMSYYMINIILVLIGYRVLGRKFIVKTLICAGLVSVFSDIFSRLGIFCDDIVLSALFGGALGGFGIGLTLIENASTGGTDVAGRIVQSKFKHIPIGKLLMIVDAVIIAASFVVFKNINLTLYGVLSLFISSSAIDLLINKLNVSRLAFIITKKGDEIAKRLIKTSQRGVTVMEAKGAYTMDKKTVLLCALKENELPEFQKKVLEIDPQAFIVFGESQQIVGNGFYVYH